MRSLILSLCVFVGVPALAAKGYQVTGPVVEVTDSKIVVQKGKEKWELARDPSTKVSGGEVKVGDKVTAYYSMTATEVEVKADKKVEKKK